tara:strand:+ start:197 stop:1267 length:1071 start_codon:yes stop_codon:yes gene_type:complete
MPLERLHLKNFRLFQDKVFKISEGTTLILGKNGSGKTSILESVNILIAGKSFRTKETKDCIKSEKEFFSISAKGKLTEKNLSLNCDNSLTNRPKYSRKLDGSPIKKEDLYFLQIVLAKNLRLLEGEPEIRKDYFNSLMFHVKPELKKLNSTYQKALKQRNRCLKKRLSQSELKLWTNEVAMLGLDLSKAQYNFFKLFKIYVKEFINTEINLSTFSFLEEVDVTFSKGWERSKKLEASLQDCTDRDTALGYTSKGPHRMDFTFSVKSKKASSNLSRGQSKILILLIFLSNYRMISELAQSEIVLMIDDLGSELDSKNLSAILEEILKINGQIILTGIEGEEMHGSLKKLANFTQINL